MDFSTILTLIQTILQLADSSPSPMQEIQFIWGIKSHLAKIKDTMLDIKAVLVDADRLDNQLSEADVVWLNKLQAVVYDTDDLFDKLNTLAHRAKLNNKVGDKVRRFLSHPAFAFKVSREVKKIRERLDDIAKDRRDFGSSLAHVGARVESDVRRKRKEENHSFVRSEDVIGRDEDKKSLISMLLGSSSVEKENVRYVSLVGIGGLGKTTLVRLVYNDDKVTNEFSLKLWACVSDPFDLKTIICALLESANKQRPSELCMDVLQSMLREAIDGRKYLIVLDDVWNESPEEWLKLRELLSGGAKGSRIVVTTRSEKVAKIIERQPFILKGLSEDDSWSLFVRMAFEEQKERDAELVDIGKEIVRKCANVPLAIRVIGSLLHGEPKSRWQIIKNTDLSNIKTKDDGTSVIISILKLSYYDLPPSLRNCFKYCAIFPKDYIFHKDILINLWMAQGFLLPSRSDGREEKGEDYFMTLVQRCFFQDVVHYNGAIDSCKIHDLMHDVAQDVARSEVVVAVADYERSSFGSGIRHLSGDENCSMKSIIHHSKYIKQIRSFIFVCNPGGEPSIIGRKFLEMRSLRVLCFYYSIMKNLPSSISNLLHLRYIDLSSNYELEELPASLTMLYNLQTLNLCYCKKLKVLPRELSKLVNLRCLDIEGCDKLSHMPSGMYNLTSLRRLTLFVVGETSNSYKKGHVGQLHDLTSLTNLSDSLHIKFLGKSGVNVEVKGKQFIQRMENLATARIEWVAGDEVRTDEDVTWLDGLQPHHNLKIFELNGYPGMRFPSWFLPEDVLPSLVEINISSCTHIQHLPCLSGLVNLEKLVLLSLFNLECIETRTNDTISQAAAVETHNALPFFPSLKELDLKNLPKLKSWWRPSSLESISNSGADAAAQPKSFPHLSRLCLSNCPILTHFPLCPLLEDLTLLHINESLSPIQTSSSVASSSSSSIASDSQQEHEVSGPSLKTVEVDNVRNLRTLTPHSLRHLRELTISYNDEIEILPEYAEVFQTHLSSLPSLKFFFCGGKLKTVRGLEYLTALKTLRLEYLHVDNSTDDDDSMTWSSLNQTLRSLTIHAAMYTVELPKGLKYLTALHSLSIEWCAYLECLPEWISCLSSLINLKIQHCPRVMSLPASMRQLTSLSRLELSYCSEVLTNRCRENGEDWPNIQHIPNVLIQIKDW